MVRNLDFVGPGVEDNRRLEVVADGGAQLAIDTTVVSALHADGTTRRRAATHDGVATAEARRRKCRTHPELVGLHGRARLMVLVVEVGGRWSHETQNFLSQLARAKARGETELMRRRAEQSWRLLAMGSILVMHCRPGGGFHDVGIPWRSRRRW